MTNNQRRFKSPANPAPVIVLLLILSITVGSLQTAPLLADEKQSSNYETLINKVQESLKNKQSLEAMKFADHAIEKDPTQYEAFSLLAIAATQLGQKDIAATAISQAVGLANREQRLKLFPIWRKIDPDGAKQAAQVRADKGTSAYADGLAFQAAQQFEEAWRINPEETAWGLQSALAYLEIKKYLLGIPLLREAALSPDDKVAAKADQQLQQINALIETIYKERMDNAAQQFEANDIIAAENNWMEAIEINPFRPDAYYELSKFYLEQDEQEQALKALRQAIRYGDRDPKRVLNKDALIGLWGTPEYLKLIEGMYGPGERKRITEEYKAELKLEDPDYDLALKLYIGDGVTIDEGRANKLFRKAADRGHALAKTFVGDSYNNGDWGIPLDQDEAIRWYQQARPALSFLAKQGNPVAQVQYGQIYDMGLGVEKNFSVAVKWYRRAAEQGYARAQYALGRNYMAGEGVAQDKAAAIKWYRKAAEQNYARAQHELGFCYSAGIGVEKNDSKAVEWYRKAAEQGLSSAQNKLGLRYTSGKGVKKDYIEALKWYRKAAEQNHAGGQYNLGYSFKSGEGVTRNYSEAMEWFQKAARQGHADAQHNVGTMYYHGLGVTKNYTTAMKWYRMAAEQGLSKSQNILGEAYQNGEGVSVDDSEAFKWFLKAAEQDHVDAQMYLGYRYYHGKGTPQDYGEALKWWRKSAAKGQVESLHNLGWMYSSGEGVTKNSVEAAKWYRKAAEQGFALSQFSLAKKYANGEGVPQNDTEAAKWYRMAAEQGHLDAQNNLGICFSKGKGVPRNYTLSVKWYRKAAEQGHAWAQNNLGYKYKNGQGVTKNEAEATKWFRKAINGTDAAAATSARKGLKSMGYTP
ncbi:hypothetical protein [uncultured Gimesia sp.]|uniref:SEL1-like repeat protein n=1 Tax=uncultured Gimesia sp. TaxID=1678688 RepID=UPI0030DBE845|tara:strand:+ start:38054 stop:40645 length:2592 start_codon:yes stop_codon:yes gene_type:complete